MITYLMQLDLTSTETDKIDWGCSSNTNACSPTTQHYKKNATKHHENKKEVFTYEGGEIIQLLVMVEFQNSIFENEKRFWRFLSSPSSHTRTIIHSSICTIEKGKWVKLDDSLSLCLSPPVQQTQEYEKYKPRMICLKIQHIGQGSLPPLIGWGNASSFALQCCHPDPLPDTWVEVTEGCLERYANIREAQGSWNGEHNSKSMRRRILTPHLFLYLN